MTLTDKLAENTAYIIRSILLAQSQLHQLENINFDNKVLKDYKQKQRQKISRFIAFNESYLRDLEIELQNLTIEMPEKENNDYASAVSKIDEVVNSLTIVI